MLAVAIGMAVGVRSSSASEEHALRAERHCSHDSLAEEQVIRAAQDYHEDARRHGRSLDESSYAPLRMRFEYGNLSGINATKQIFLRDELMPAAAQFLSSALSVLPVSSPLLASRQPCPFVWAGTDVCAGASPSHYCGVAGDDARVTIPESMLQAVRVCSVCNNAPGMNDCSGAGSVCNDLAAGAGVDGTDFVLFVTAKAVRARRTRLSAQSRPSPHAWCISHSYWCAFVCAVFHLRWRDPRLRHRMPARPVRPAHLCSHQLLPGQVQHRRFQRARVSQDGCYT